MPYFDCNATTPLTPAAREAWLRAQDEAWQNPSSPYGAASRVRLRIEAAREKLAGFLGCAPKRIVFNSGATEGANAICAHLARALPADVRVAVNPTEHPCVLEAAKFYFGERIAWLEMNRDGAINLAAVEKLLATEKIGAIIAMAANNETGVLQPWRELAKICRARRAVFFCDASQWIGKLPSDGLSEVDWAIASAHKFGGPKGVGFMLVPETADSFRAQQGGEQEHGHRAGTEDLPAIAAMIAALVEVETKKVLSETERLRWRETFERAVTAALPGVKIVGAGAERLWNTVSLVMPHGENTRWVARLDKRDFQVSTGSACATGKEGPSHVLAAMGYAPGEARRVIRVSAGWETTEADWKNLLPALVAVSAEVKPSEAVVKS